MKKNTKGLNVEENSISLVPGVTIGLANGQIPMNFFYSKHQNSSEYAKIGLQAAGIDMSRTFIINETKFHFDEEG